MTDPIHDAWWPASAFAQAGLDADQLRMAADRGDIACQRPHTELNPTGRRRYRVADVEARWPECFSQRRTNPNETELSTDSGGNCLTPDRTGGMFDNMSSVVIPFPSLRRAAAQLGVSEAYLRRQVAGGLIPIIKDGRRVLVDLEGTRQALATAARQQVMAGENRPSR